MPANYTGNPTAITPHDAPVISCPVDADPGNAASVNTPLQKLADVLAFLQQYAPIMGAGVANEGPLEIAGNLSVGGSVKSGAPIGATDLKLVSEHPGYGTGAGSVRRYAVGNSTTLAMVEVINAYWGIGSAWVREFADQPAYLIRLSQAGLRVMAWPVGDATPFARELRLFEAGMKWSGVGTGAADANPPAGTAVKNELRAKNVCKAWAKIAVVAGAASVVDGFNVPAGSLVVTPGSGTPGTIALPFLEAMANSDYAVSVTLGYAPNLNAWPVVVSQTPGSVSLGLGNGNTGVPSFNTFTLHVVVFGCQNS